MSACCERRGLVSGEVAVADKTNELGAIRPLLIQLLLAGVTLTFEPSTPCSPRARSLRRWWPAGAYVMRLKGNQHALLRDFVVVTAQPPRHPVRNVGQARSLEGANGRVEERTLRAVEAHPDPGVPGVPHARQVLRTRRRSRSERTGAVPFEKTVYALTSLRPTQAMMTR